MFLFGYSHDSNFLARVFLYSIDAFIKDLIFNLYLNYISNYYNYYDVLNNTLSSNAYLCDSLVDQSLDKIEWQHNKQ